MRRLRPKSAAARCCGKAFRAVFYHFRRSTVNSSENLTKPASQSMATRIHQKRGNDKVRSFLREKTNMNKLKSSVTEIRPGPSCADSSVFAQLFANTDQTALCAVWSVAYPNEINARRGGSVLQAEDSDNAGVPINCTSFIYGCDPSALSPRGSAGGWARERSR